MRSLIRSLREIASHISAAARRRFAFVLVLMVAGAFAELISIGAVLPFLAVVADPAAAAADPRLKPILTALNISTQFQLIAAATLTFAVAAVTAAGVRLMLAWHSQRFAFDVIHELGVAVFRRSLYQPYAYHLDHNSSETIGAVNKTQVAAAGVIIPMMQAAIGLVIAGMILLGLVLIDPMVAIASGLGVAVIYALVIWVTKAVMRRNGDIFAKAMTERIQVASEGLGGIRDILLDNTQGVFVARFEEVEGRLRRSQSANSFMGAAPRMIVEGLGVMAIAILTFSLSFRAGGLVAALPTLGAMALGAQRLLPLIQQIYLGWASYLNAGRSLEDILDILRLADAPQYRAALPAPISFRKEIALESVSFRYPASEQMVVDQLDLRIPRGSRTGFVGTTGSGKSTVMDLILGLSAPTEGRILVDGVAISDENRSAWQRRVAHVPQAIYLSDATVAENIAFGIAIRDIDMERVRQSAAQAKLVDVIEQLPRGYDTPVGERGVRLSGGQRQRLGIARALYKQADVLIFDEATSALDTETEKAVMEAIDALDRDLTIIIIAHRLTTVEGCDTIVRLSANTPAKISRKAVAATLENT